MPQIPPGLSAAAPPCTDSRVGSMVCAVVLQGLLCGVIQVIVQKLTENDAAKAGVLQYSDNIMEVLLRVFACRKGSVHEEAMMAVVSQDILVG